MHRLHTLLYSPHRFLCHSVRAVRAFIPSPPPTHSPSSNNESTRPWHTLVTLIIDSICVCSRDSISVITTFVDLSLLSCKPSNKGSLASDGPGRGVRVVIFEAPTSVGRAKWYNVIDDKDSVIFPRALIEIIELWSLTFACPLYMASVWLETRHVHSLSCHKCWKIVSVHFVCL